MTQLYEFKKSENESLGSFHLVLKECGNTHFCFKFKRDLSLVNFSVCISNKCLDVDLSYLLAAQYLIGIYLCKNLFILYLPILYILIQAAAPIDVAW